jgi:hypothetical protein
VAGRALEVGGIAANELGGQTSTLPTEGYEVTCTGQALVCSRAVAGEAA